MKSLFGTTVVIFVFLLVVAAGALIWYLSKTAEFSREQPAPVEQVR